MATMHFDGVDDEVRGTGNGAMSGAVSAFFLTQVDGTATWRDLLTGYDSGGNYQFVFSHLNSFFYQWAVNAGGGSGGTSATSINPSSTDWWIVGFTKGAGTVTPRYHFRNVTTGAAWVHEAGSNTTVNSTSCAGGQMQFGNYGATAGTLSEDYVGDIGLVAWWDGTALSDAQCAELDVNHKTSDWHNCTGGTPSSLTEGNTLTPTDLEGLMTWSTVTVSGLTGGDPTGWTFDGTGAAPPSDAPEVLRVLTSPLRW